MYIKMFPFHVICVLDFYPDYKLFDNILKNQYRCFCCAHVGSVLFRHLSQFDRKSDNETDSGKHFRCEWNYVSILLRFSEFMLPTAV